MAGKPKCELPKEVDADKLYELLMNIVERLEENETQLDHLDKRVGGLELGGYFCDEESEDEPH